MKSTEFYQYLKPSLTCVVKEVPSDSCEVWRLEAPQESVQYLKTSAQWLHQPSIWNFGDQMRLTHLRDKRLGVGDKQMLLLWKEEFCNGLLASINTPKHIHQVWPGGSGELHLWVAPEATFLHEVLEQTVYRPDLEKHWAVGEKPGISPGAQACVCREHSGVGSSH